MTLLSLREREVLSLFAEGPIMEGATLDPYEADIERLVSKGLLEENMTWAVATYSLTREGSAALAP